MQNEIQLLSFIISFAFGVLFAFLNELNTKIIKKENTRFKIIITFLFVANMALLFLFFLYKVNNGIIHFYFLLFATLGFLMKYHQPKMLIKIVKRMSNSIKKLKKPKNS